MQTCRVFPRFGDQAPQKGVCLSSRTHKVIMREKWVCLRSGTHKENMQEMGISLSCWIHKHARDGLPKLWDSQGKHAREGLPKL